jgi:hypothetical protein
MFTIFSCPKDFTSLFGIIQRNAINSWLKLDPKPYIILFGIENEDIKNEFNDENIIFLPINEINEYKTPYINRIFESAIKHSPSDTLCYVNSDIILFNDFPKTIENLISHKKYFGVGNRYNVEINHLINFSDGSFDKRNYLVEENIDIYTGSDYFIFNKHALKDIPQFLIGRTCWDNWLMYNAVKDNLNLIDCSAEISCIHQKHDYSHIKTSKSKHYKGVERDFNFKSLGGIGKLYTILDAKYYFFNGALKRNIRINTISHKILRYLGVLFLKEYISLKLKNLSLN